ncbi:MAG: PIN domain-containing protein, partial [Mycobacteriaceae bacterium]|nr:PIN domain-containing protein [Mycobacteriaceae bacterium]
MILPDLNVLVYAFREGEKNSAKYKAWLTDLISGSDEMALLDSVLANFVRVVTDPRIAEPPATTARALAFVDDLRSAPKARWLQPGASVWDTFDSLASQDRTVAGSLVPEAYVAANAIVHGAVLATADRAYGRFHGLRWFDPADT